MAISQSERTFIGGGVAVNMRADGRGRSDYRAFDVTTGMITSAGGSARVRLDETDVLVWKERREVVVCNESYDDLKIQGCRAAGEKQ